MDWGSAAMIWGNHAEPTAIRRWTTADEVAYLRHLGTTVTIAGVFTRTQMLEHYLEAAEKRTRWEHLDRYYIITKAKAFLDAERERCAESSH